jgi:hypothetical protein
VRQRLRWAIDRDPTLYQALWTAGVLPELRLGFVKPDGTDATPDEIGEHQEAAFFQGGTDWMTGPFGGPDEVLAEARQRYIGPAADGWGISLGMWAGYGWSFTRLA